MASLPCQIIDINFGRYSGRLPNTE